MEIGVRVANAGDAELVGRILRSSYPPLLAGHYEASVLARALPFMTCANPSLLTSGTFFLADIAGQAVGCGGWTHEEPGTGKVERGLAHIRHFAVCGDWIGRGVGSALYARCETEAREAGVTRLWCYSTLNGQRFYEAIGFGSPEPMQVAMGPDLLFPAVRMSRDIGRP